MNKWFILFLLSFACTAQQAQAEIYKIVGADGKVALRAVKVVLDPMQTGPAIRTYNIMIGERRRVAAALIAVP